MKIFVLEEVLETTGDVTGAWLVHDVASAKEFYELCCFEDGVRKYRLVEAEQLENGAFKTTRQKPESEWKE